MNDLINLIMAHGHDKPLIVGNSLVVTSAYGNSQEYTMVSETIPATIQAVREWLGY